MVASLHDAGAGRGACSTCVHEMRVPGGETLYDREVRLQRLKSRTPA